MSEGVPLTPTQVAQLRAKGFIDAMHEAKLAGRVSPKERLRQRYETLREDYASGRIDLETFTAGAVSLLREGLS